MMILVLDETFSYKVVDSDFKLIICQMMNLNPKERSTADQHMLIPLFRKILNTFVIPLKIQPKIKSCFWIAEIESFSIHISKI
jgi:hypothetical protein